MDLIPGAEDNSVVPALANPLYLYVEVSRIEMATAYIRPLREQSPARGLKEAAYPSQDKYPHDRTG
jgi:hypothetical protein